MARSLIGIAGQFEAAHWGDWVREAVLSPLSCTRAVERAGGTPVILPPVPADSVARLTQSVDGIVFTCGTDVNPALYDARPAVRGGDRRLPSVWPALALKVRLDDRQRRPAARRGEVRRGPPPAAP